MDIIKKIDEGHYSITELENFLGESNPIIVYHTMTYIGKNKCRTQGVLEKLNELSFKRSPQDKLIGYYKIGDLALATLMKLSEKDNGISFSETLSDFDRKMIVRLYEEIDW